jgi:hypothetical protein
MYSVDDKVPDFSNYTKIKVMSQKEISEIPNPTNSRLSDPGDDSLDGGSSDGSFDRDEVEVSHSIVELPTEKRKPQSVIIDKERTEDARIKKNNDNISKFLESSIGIEIQKPVDIDANEEEKIKDESSLDLIDSSNSSNFQFYDSSNNGKHSKGG